MPKDESIFTKKQPKEISEGLQNFIDSMVEEIVLEGKPFDSQKKYLKKFSENEGLDYDKLEADITTFIEVLESLKTALNKLQVKLAEEKGKECHISEDTIQKLVDYSSQPHQKEQEETLIDKKDGTGKGGSLNKTFLLGGVGLLLLVVILLLFKWYSDNNVSKSDTEMNIQRDSVVSIQNSSEAEQQYRSDAERGDAEAQYCLGYCYYCGVKGLPKSYSEAIKWFTKAANQGYARAQYELGNCYVNGLGVSQNLEEAKIWYEKAADQGYSRAIDELEVIKRMESQAKDPQVVELTISAPSWNGKVLQGEFKDKFKLREVKNVPKGSWRYDKPKEWLDENDLQLEYTNYTRNSEGVFIGEKKDVDLSVFPASYNGEPLQRYEFRDSFYSAFYAKKHWDYNYLMVFDIKENVLYKLDFTSFSKAPYTNPGDEDYVVQGVRYPNLVGNVLYIQHGHGYYANGSGKKNAYISAIDLNSGKILWTTQPLTCNSDFIIIDNTIICGYGYSEEPDYIYLVDLATGKRRQTIKVASAADYVVRKEDKVYVLTYDKQYVYDIVR